MGFIVMDTLQILIINQQCGPKIGPDGFFRLVGPCLIDPWKILLFRLHDFTKEVERFKIITWLVL